MIKVHFYSEGEIPQELFKFAVIAAAYRDKWIFCRHKLRDTWEIPGGHREIGEDIVETARRELYEETGALNFVINPVSVYGVESDGQTTYGALFYADVKVLGELPPDMEIGEIMLSRDLPEKLTYPEIQPYLFEMTRKFMITENTRDFSDGRFKRYKQQ